MADTWGGAKRMADAARQAGVQLTFNHQRRYGAPFMMAKRVLDKGRIGELTRLESDCGNIYDSGTHFIDMFSFFNGEQPANGCWRRSIIVRRTWFLARIAKTSRSCSPSTRMASSA
jgi:predicted dehydrogenase